MGLFPPLSSTQRPREDLAQAYYGFNPQAMGFVIPEIFTSFPAAEMMGAFGVVERETWLRTYNTKRAMGAESSQSGWAPDGDTFQLLTYAHKQPVYRDEERVYGTWFELQELATQRVRRVIQADLENDGVSAIQAALPTSGHTGETVGNAWDTAGGTPMSDVESGRAAIEDNYGVEPNLLVIGRKVHRGLMNSDEFSGAFTQNFGQVIPQLIDVDMLARIFQIERVIIAHATAATNEPGQPTTVGKLWPDDMAGLFTTNAGRDLKTPQFGRLFELSEFQGTRISSWEIWDPDGEVIRAEAIQQPKTMKEPAGYRFAGVG